jgi:hypothetical protein
MWPPVSTMGYRSRRYNFSVATNQDNLAAFLSIREAPERVVWNRTRYSSGVIPILRRKARRSVAVEPNPEA